MKTNQRIAWACAHINLAIALGLAVFFCFAPAVLLVWNLFDPGIAGNQIPKMTLGLHHRLAPTLDRWARDRVASEKAAALTGENVPGTEWPIFTALFFLWSTETLQAAWEQGDQRAAPAPKDDARRAINSLTALVLDPNHAAWVRRLWGDDYLHHDNLFYRYARIAAMTSHYRLSADAQYLPMLRDEVDRLAADLDCSPAGLLEDYPEECYPADVLAAWMCIKRADAALGMDHGAALARGRRAFEGTTLDAHGLPPYLADAVRGWPVGPARGCSNSYICSVAPDLWPDAAAVWYAAYEAHFWQERWGAAGFREFARDAGESDWYVDVDSGPSVAGHGVSASAFGVSAARLNGRFDHAYPLAAEMLAVSWMLPNGRLLMPRILSNAVHAPYLGETAILWQLTRTTPRDIPIRDGGALPPLVPGMLLAYCFVGGLTIFAAIRAGKAVQRAVLPAPRIQAAVWAMLLFGSAAMLCAGWTAGSLMALLCALILPRTRGRRPGREAAAEPSPVPSPLSPQQP